MSDEPAVSREHHDAGIGPARLVAFSDGVLAIIITITVLSIRPPDGTDFPALARRFPALLIYLLSFMAIAIYWNNHHHLFRVTERIGGSVMWANLHLLFWLSLLPIVTDWVGNDYKHALPAAVYGAIALMAAIAYDLMVRRMARTDRHFAEIAATWGVDVKRYGSESIYALGIGLAFLPFGPWLAYTCYAVVAAIWFIPDPRLASHTHPAGAAND